MIRLLDADDLDAVLRIWLEANIQAHDFIPQSYWEAHFETVKEVLPQAEIYVHQHAQTIAGFVGLDGHYIAGIFVASNMRSNGFGKMLLDHCKGLYDTLSLRVYQKNERALHFYQREGFAVDALEIDAATGQAEYQMTWHKEAPPQATEPVSHDLISFDNQNR
jgi:ribosomal protein S18 acetylase RimI-like enzyme